MDLINLNEFAKYAMNITSFSLLDFKNQNTVKMMQSVLKLGPNSKISVRNLKS